MTSQAGVRQEVYGGNLGKTLGAVLRDGAGRSVLRFIAMSVWTAGLLVLLVAGIWCTAPWPERQRWWRSRIVRRWARGVTWIIGMRVTVRGTRPAPPFFLVSNHLSYCDIVLLLGELPAVFVAKQEVNAWPAIGYLTRLVGTIFVDRTRPRHAKRVLETMSQRLDSGEGVIVFPEGTSSGGDDVLPMRPALFEWAAHARVPVHVAAIHYVTPPDMPPAREAVCWWGDMPFVPHLIQLLQMRGFDATLHFAERQVMGSDRGVLAERARTAVVRILSSHRIERRTS